MKAMGKWEKKSRRGRDRKGIARASHRKTAAMERRKESEQTRRRGVINLSKGRGSP